MKIVIIGGTGLIGSKTVERLRKKGHEVVAASPRSGVNTVTGEGLAEAIASAQVVVDVSNSPSFDEKVATEFFNASNRNLLAAEAAAGVKHHVALSIVGMERVRGYGYYRAKLIQENLIKNSKIPYTIVRATQFFEFTSAIAQSGTAGQTVTMSSAFCQPIAADEVADVMAEVALGVPVNGTIEIGGPERVRLNELVERFLKATKDPRKVVADAHAPFFGMEVDDKSIVPGKDARLGKTHFEDWLKNSVK